MNFFENLVAPKEKIIPPKPTIQQISEMVRRVEERANAEMKFHSREEELDGENPHDPRFNTSFDPYYIVSPNDSFEWFILCVRARKISFELYSVLWYIRGCGTRLIKDEFWGYVMKPDIQEGGWESTEHWNRDKHIMDTWRNEIVDLLATI